MIARSLAKRKSPLVMGLDILFFSGSLLLAVFIAKDFHGAVPHPEFVWPAVIGLAGFGPVVCFFRGIYRINARYIGLYDFINLLLAAGILGGIYGAVQLWLAPGKLPLSVPFLYTFLLGTALTGTRVGMRLASWRQRPINPAIENPVRTLIVGAGDAGEMMLREIMKSPANKRVVKGFIDDDPEKRHLILNGIRVQGSTEDISHLVDALEIDEIIIAVPTATSEQMRRIAESCRMTRAKVRTLPSVSKLLLGTQELRDQLKDVDIEDLLAREVSAPAPRTALSYLEGESVMITGGGGSIGSELARQVARVSPGHLVLFGKGENSIYDIEQELLMTTNLIPSARIGDVRDRATLRRAFERYMPSVVFHAAAHKHVPLMETAPIEAILNNVFGTLRTAETAIQFGVKRFVLISTDKAVNPTSVMGATKRVGEMIVSSLAARSETSFAVVRFGNVLGSRGSLVPVLEKQIARGGPVRITHPEMTRYFMTIPEAVQLILQAGSTENSGQLFILDMGAPVRIVDIAKDLIRLHGLKPDVDIEIKFVGIRPGEKIHEELVYSQEELIPTEHPKIRSTHQAPPDWDWLRAELAILQQLCDAGDAEMAKQFLMELARGSRSLGASGAVMMPTPVANPEESSRPE